jgi:hypothetical protein
MEHTFIAQLLDKYWDGDTSLEEERLLRSYFNGSAVAPEFAAITPLFQAIMAEKAVEMPASAAPLRALRSNGWRSYAAAAAVAGLLAVGGWLAYQQTAAPLAQNVATTDTCENPEQAVAEIKAALALVSSKLNKGQQTAAKGLQHVETVQRFIKIPVGSPADPSQF